MEDNVARTRRGFEAFGRGDLDEIREMFDPDIVWHVPGRSEVAGEYRGIDAVIGYFIDTFERSGGSFKAELVECGEIAPDHVACLVRLTGDMPGGSIDEQVMQLFIERDGKTIECLNFSRDQYALDESLSASGAITLPDARTETPATVNR